ncbi:PP2C family protein-serine/threonine phosphatase [Oceanidesulfovibrio marinus]|uniref:Fused response regulator/phosphatase n=1 Tax=Oceanidesulfovibrio marinus TaxID=370038 RepID=A0ABX6NE20_9BACT|nr:fused response regulator/phosphatase [Oceanidesulfovibrio marinus]QJT08837.1 fused response regulator/phosphatase [Oceanidesulfovibrio marinus]
MTTNAMQQNVRILIVDDSRTMRQALETILAERYEVRTARDGRHALEVLDSFAPNILLLDIIMPRLDGFGVIEHIRRVRRDEQTFIIMLTAESAQDIKPKALNLGANDFLLKPFDQVELLARIGVAARQVRLTQELHHSMERISREIETVAALQTRLLPKESPYLEKVQLQSLYRPSGQASGDYFDYAVLNDDVLRVAIADVSGHGARAAFLMAIVRTLFKLSLEHDLSIEETMRTINSQLVDIIGDEADFVTAFAADLNLKKSTLSYINAGHCPGLLHTAGGTNVQLNSTHPLLGFFPIDFGCRTLPFSEEYSLFLFTDGFYEWERKPGVFFELDDFLELAEGLMPTKESFLENLIASLKAAGGKLPVFRDDLTALWVHRGEADG